MPRKQVQNLQRRQLTPAAQPVDTYVRPNKRGPEPTDDLQGLARFSQTLTGVLSYLSDEYVKDEITRFEALELQNTEALDANKKAFAKKVGDGEIAPEESPWARIGRARGRTRRLLTHYESALNHELEQELKRAQTVDPMTGQSPEDIRSPDQIAADLWGQMLDRAGDLKGSLSASQLINQMKPGIDRNFSLRASQAFGALQTKQQLEDFNMNLIEIFDRSFQSRDESGQAQFDDIDALNSFALEEGYKSSIPNIRDVTEQALVAWVTKARAAGESASDIKAYVRSFEGKLDMGSSKFSGENGLDKVLLNLTQEELRQGGKLESERRLGLSRALDYVEQNHAVEFIEAAREGPAALEAALSAAIDSVRITDDILARDKPYVYRELMDAFKFATAVPLAKTSETYEQLSGVQAHLDNGNVDGAKLMLDRLQADGRIGQDEYLQIKAEIDKASDWTRYRHTNPVWASYNSQIQGFGSDLKRALGQAFDYTRDYKHVELLESEFMKRSRAIAEKAVTLPQGEQREYFQTEMETLWSRLQSENNAYLAKRSQDRDKLDEVIYESGLSSQNQSHRYKDLADREVIPKHLLPGLQRRETSRVNTRVSRAMSAAKPYIQDYEKGLLSQIWVEIPKDEKERLLVERLGRIGAADYTSGMSVPSSGLIRQLIPQERIDSVKKKVLEYRDQIQTVIRNFTGTDDELIRAAEEAAQEFIRPSSKDQYYLTSQALGEAGRTAEAAGALAQVQDSEEARKVRDQAQAQLAEVAKMRQAAKEQYMSQGVWDEANLGTDPAPDRVSSLEDFAAAANSGRGGKFFGSKNELESHRDFWDAASDTVAQALLPSSSPVSVSDFGDLPHFETYLGLHLETLQYIDMIDEDRNALVNFRATVEEVEALDKLESGSLEWIDAARKYYAKARDRARGENRDLSIPSVRAALAAEDEGDMKPYVDAALRLSRRNLGTQDPRRAIIRMFDLGEQVYARVEAKEDPSREIRDIKFLKENLQSDMARYMRWTRRQSHPNITSQRDFSPEEFIHVMGYVGIDARNFLNKEFRFHYNYEPMPAAEVQEKLSEIDERIAKAKSPTTKARLRQERHLVSLASDDLVFQIPDAVLEDYPWETHAAFADYRQLENMIQYKDREMLTALLSAFNIPTVRDDGEWETLVNDPNVQLFLEAQHAVFMKIPTEVFE